MVKIWKPKVIILKKFVIFILVELLLLKKTEYWDGDYPWLSSGETKQDFIENTDKTITKEGIKILPPN